jgi:hypothetical protein
MQGKCPNVASVNLPGSIGMAKRFHVPLCKACTCRADGCCNGARRPYGGGLNLALSYGFCKRHWTRD